MSSRIILAIDENKDTTWLYKALAKLLPSEQIQLSLVFSGREGLAFLKTQQPRVIICGQSSNTCKKRI